jgi:hypothetical protein
VNATVEAEGPVSEETPSLRTAVAKTLVPDLPTASERRSAAEKKALSRSSRLAAALKEPRRALSPAAQAAIERGAQAAQPGRTIPTGLQGASTLARMTRDRISGLVIAVTPKGSVTPTTAYQHRIASLLGPDDFAAPMEAGGFVLVLPNLHGAAAQQRLQDVAQRLTTIQAQYGVSFEWSSIEVESELIADAIGGALQQRESRADRKLPAGQKPKALQQAV